MANTVIQLKHSTEIGNVPSSLANGEISINSRDGKFFYSTPTGSIITHYPYLGPSGLNKEIQFNDSGTLGSNSGLTFHKTSGLLNVSTTLIVSGRDLGAYANAAFNTANAAFVAANAATATDTTQNNSITAAFAAANAATATDTTQNNSITVALNTANAAFLRANTPSHVANSAASYANSAFAAANAATSAANAAFAAANTSSANIIYVAKNGSNSNTGGLTSPLLTIESAMNMAAGLSGNVSIHVAPGTYVEDMPITIPPNTALMGDNLRNVFIKPLVAASDMFYMSGGSYVWGVTVRDYTGKAFSYDPNTVTTAFVSPYIQNITSSTTTGTAVYIDGDKCTGTKAMIVGFFTIINRGGIGIHLVNSAYSQSVNIYTIACDIGIKVESGSFITLNGSDCSIGNYGLVAEGKGSLQTSGTIVSQFQGTFVIGSLSNGQPNVNTVLLVDGDPEYYTIDTILPNIPAVGNSTVSVQQRYLGDAGPGINVSFYTRSSIIASAHTFEYVGAGTNPATALPQYGGIPIEANEVVSSNGAVITYTSTDQKGNFKVGSGLIINQATATITGDAFYKSLFAQMTPYILAISGD